MADPAYAPPATYGEAWRIPALVDPDEFGVLVKVGPDTWWLLCPSTATLYLDRPDGEEGSCSNADCQWPDVHAAAASVAREVVGAGHGQREPAKPDLESCAGCGGAVLPLLAPCRSGGGSCDRACADCGAHYPRRRPETEARGG